MSAGPTASRGLSASVCEQRTASLAQTTEAPAASDAPPGPEPESALRTRRLCP